MEACRQEMEKREREREWESGEQVLPSLLCLRIFALAAHICSLYIFYPGTPIEGVSTIHWAIFIGAKCRWNLCLESAWFDMKNASPKCLKLKHIGPSCNRNLVKSETHATSCALEKICVKCAQGTFRRFVYCSRIGNQLCNKCQSQSGCRVGRSIHQHGAFCARHAMEKRVTKHFNGTEAPRCQLAAWACGFKKHTAIMALFRTMLEFVIDWKQI